MLALLPGQLDLLHRTSESIKNPLFRFLEREVTVASQLLDVVRNDLVLLTEMCKGERKSTNILKTLAEELHADVIPKKWRSYVVGDITSTMWVNDFVKRIEQLKELSAAKDFGQSGLWFGGLLFPGAYLTATRQSVAQNKGYSLEELSLDIEVLQEGETINDPEISFVMTGFAMQGAEFVKDLGGIKLSQSLGSNLPNVVLRWVKKDKQTLEEEVETKIQIPVYLTK
jgi:dynein heavy chain 1, cytosolic